MYSPYPNNLIVITPRVWTIGVQTVFAEDHRSAWADSMARTHNERIKS